MIFRSVLLLLYLVLFSSALIAQDEFYHPELDWNTIETEHFLVHYHTGTERTAQVVAKIAEDIYEPVVSLYNHKPDEKVSFIIKDHDDISNGAAYFYNNKVEIYAPSMDFDLRGTHNWLRNVVTHEFTHIVQIQTAMKFGRGIPGFYFQFLGYESERRPDILYGFPNVIVSYPFSGFVVPVWFAEGVAQYNRTDFRYDFWDSHRDMILRSYALDGNMLTWEQMGVFGKTSLGNESSYNAGFAFVSYLARVYGEDKLREISRNLGKFGATTIEGAIKDAVGKDGAEVYADWRAEVERDYAKRTADIRSSVREGSVIPVLDDDEVQFGMPAVHPAPRIQHPYSERRMMQCCAVSFSTGFANLYPRYSRDGQKIAYVSNKNGDYFGQSTMYVYDARTQKEEPIQGGVRTAMSWSPDGKKLYYSRSWRDNPHWSLQFDVYVYDLTTKDETRLTNGARALSPAVSPDGSLLAFTVNKDGTSNLAVMNVNGGDIRIITPYAHGEQVYTPQWSASGDRIVFDYSVKDGRDIAVVNPDGTGLQFLIKGNDDSRSAVFSPDGSSIVFSSDRTGIFNLYRYTLATGATEQMTNVLGGAFLPTVNDSGDIVYASYTSSGYKIVRLDDPIPVAAQPGSYVRDPYDVPGLSSATALRQSETSQFPWESLRAYNDSSFTPLNSKPYKARFTSVNFVPFVRVDNYNTSDNALDAIKPGVYLFSNDVLEKTGFFAGAALSKRLERDLFLQFFYRSKLPLLYDIGLEPVASAELYNITRKAKDAIDIPPVVPVDLTYNLLQFDFALNQPFVSQFSNAELRFAHSRYTSIIESFVNPNNFQVIPGFSNLYFIGNDLSLKFSMDAIIPSRTSEINPVGRKITLRIGREWDQLLNDYSVDNGLLVPVYNQFNFTRLELKWREHLPLFFKNHTLTMTLHGGTILENTVDEFFDFYAGGLIGMRGYPYYSIGGNEMLLGSLEYRIPLIHNIDVRFLQIYFDKLYLSAFADMGNAWSGAIPSLREFKTDIGAELRLESFSWYAYPTRVFFSAAYGFDDFERFVRNLDTVVSYGQEWRFSFGILFGFDFD